MTTLIMLASEEKVELEPFAHQVGGHSSVMLLDRQRVCKPVVVQELEFYQRLPDEIRQFTPEFYGLVYVRLEEDVGGLSRLVAYAGKDSAKRIRRRARRSDGSLRVRLRSGHVETFIPPTGNRRFGSHLGCGVNPWSLRCYSRMVEDMISSGAAGQTHDFIVLENMASRFRYPCVLDIKMGTRQHGDDATLEKRLRQEAKCAASTSLSFGLRLCGMQVFHVDSKRFVCYNKYLGRRLHGEDELSSHLALFLNNGCQRRTDVIAPLVKRLGELRAVLRAQETLRFYSTSLLLVYEGDIQDSSMHEKGGHPLVDVRIIDFAHTTFDGMLTSHPAARHDGPDHGFLLGLDNLISLLSGLQSEHDVTMTSSAVKHDVSVTSSTAKHDIDSTTPSPPYESAEADAMGASSS